MGGRFQNTGRGSGARNGGRGNGHQGRGNQSNNGAKNTKTNGKNGQREKKFHPLTRGKTPEHSFDEVKKSLIVKISTMKMDHINDMIESVKDMKLFDIKAKEPKLVLITDASDPDKDTKNEQLKANFLADRKDWKTRENAFENNKRYVYGKIMSACTKQMVDKLEREPDYETVLFNDPIQLLKKIQKFMTITPDTEWEYFGLWQAMQKLFTCHQKEKEDIATYRKRFEEMAEAVKSLVGDNILERFAEKSQGFAQLSTSDEKQRYKDETWERFIANGFIFNSDRAKYQSRIDTMTAQYNLKHLDFKQRCTFPTTMENAAEVLNLHKHDNRKKKFQNNGDKGNKNGQATCNNQNNESDGSQFAQKENCACFVCGSKDHVAPDCPDKLRPKDKWKNPEKYKDYSRPGGN